MTTASLVAFVLVLPPRDCHATPAGRLTCQRRIIPVWTSSKGHMLHRYRTKVPLPDIPAQLIHALRPFVVHSHLRTRGSGPIIGTEQLLAAEFPTSGRAGFKVLCSCSDTFSKHMPSVTRSADMRRSAGMAGDEKGPRRRIEWELMIFIVNVYIFASVHIGINGGQHSRIPAFIAQIPAGLTIGIWLLSADHELDRLFERFRPGPASRRTFWLFSRSLQRKPLLGFA